jgi:hypothetical protein
MGGQIKFKFTSSASKDSRKKLLRKSHDKDYSEISSEFLALKKV